MICLSQVTGLFTSLHLSPHLFPHALSGWMLSPDDGQLFVTPLAFPRALAGLDAVPT